MEDYIFLVQWSDDHHVTKHDENLHYGLYLSEVVLECSVHRTATDINVSSTREVKSKHVLFGETGKG